MKLNGKDLKERQMRRNYYTGKYALDKNEFLNAKYYALRYNKWRDEYEALEDTGRGIRYDKEKVQTSGDYDPVQENGIRRAELAKKLEIIEQTVKEVDKDLYQWILQGVTDEFATYTYLRMTKNMPCGDQKYYRLRRKFYYLLAQKL